MHGLRVCAKGSEFAVSAHESGWHRWILPSRDGLTRKYDPAAPWVTLGPAGGLRSLYLCHGSQRERVWSWSWFVDVLALSA